MDQFQDRNKMTNEKNKWLKPLLIVVGIVLLVWTLLVAIHVPYSDTEYYYEKEPYQTKEYYYIKEPYQISVTDYYLINAKNCDYDSDCRCIHYNFWGTCDSCRCRRERIITKYRDVRKSRIVTKYRDVQKSRTVTKYCNLWKKIAGWC